MTTPLRLYVLDGGMLDIDAAVFQPDLPRGSRRRVPIPMYVLRHGDTWVLIDTGCRPEVVGDAAAAWGGLARAIRPLVTAEQLADAQLRRLGLRPDTIDLIINTHWHMDHAGGNRLFPQTPILVHERERSFASRPQAEGQGYFRAEWDLPLTYRYLRQDTTDVFDDGSMLLHRVGGHTPGHLAVEVRLPQTGPLLLTVDVLPFASNLQGSVPRNNYHAEETLQARTWVAQLMAQGYRVLFGHDPDSLRDVPQPPLYYD